MAKPTVHIRYGIFGGELNGIRLRKLIRQAGYSVTRHSNQADIIMAHSAGCFWLDALPGRQKLMLIDPPYWPNRSARERARSRARRNICFRRYGYTWRRWFYRNGTGVYYLLRDFRRTLRIMRHAPRFNLERTIKDRQVLLVRNQHDDWLTPELSDLQARYPRLQVVEVPGDHDDITYNPGRYVALLNRLA